MSPGDATQPLADAHVHCGAEHLPGPRRTEAACLRREGSPPCLRGLQESGFVTRGLKRTCFPGRPTGRPPRHSPSVPATTWAPLCSRAGDTAVRGGARPRARGPWQAGGRTPRHVGLCGCSETSGPSPPSVPWSLPPGAQRTFSLCRATWTAGAWGRGTGDSAQSPNAPEATTPGQWHMQGGPRVAPNVDRSAEGTCGNGILRRGSAAPYGPVPSVSVCRPGRLW